LKGAVVKANMRLPFGASGIVDGAGGFVLPGLPLNSVITLSMYDPNTGLFDPDVATVATSSEENAVYSPIVVFNPDTTCYRVPMALGQVKSDEITSGRECIEFRIEMGEDMVGTEVNIGFGAETPLTILVRDPSYNLIAMESDATCEVIGEIPIGEAGVYTIRITRSVSGIGGPFEVGVDIAPNYPIHYLCGDVSGVLAREQSPYRVPSAATVQSGDTLVWQSGVEVLSSTGGTLVNYGNVDIQSGHFVVGSGLRFSQGQGGTITSNGCRLSRATVVATGLLTHERGVLGGVDLSLDTLVVETGGKIDVGSRGYRGVGRDGWAGVDESETYPGYLGATEYSGGSHGGLGGGGYAGQVYDSLDAPFAMGAGGSSRAGVRRGGNGGGLIRVSADVFVLNGELQANGENASDWVSGGGAGGAINISAREISGNGIIRADGGNGGPTPSGGGGGGRIAIRWEAGDVNSWQVYANGGAGSGSGGGNGGAGTIYKEQVVGTPTGGRRTK
jgi:hypothetical protein